jgi:hypothetical protein
VNPFYILPFYENFNACKWERFNSGKICQITYARIQGLNAFLDHFYSSGVNNHQVVPLMLSVPPLPAIALSEYERNLRNVMKEDKLKQLAEFNERVFGAK